MRRIHGWTSLAAAATLALGCAAAATPAQAARRTTRRTAQTCRPGSDETVVHRGGEVLVTLARSGSDMSWVDRYRACRLPGGRFTTLGTYASGGGGGGGSYSSVQFASAGSWLAWSADYVSHAPGGEHTTVNVTDLRSSVRASPTTFTSAPRTFVATTALTVAADGVVAWVRRENRSPDGIVQVRQELQVGWPHGRQQTLDSWAGPMAEEDAHALTDPAIGRDGRTVTWRNAGESRSATLPGDGSEQPSDPTAVATGRSSDPAARLRLAGRDLTVVLDRRLTPRGFRGRPAVRVVCGDSAQDPAAIRSLDWMLLAAKAERSLRVGAGTRIVRARLDANVASRANWCGLRWRSRAGNRYLNAPMALRSGRAASCVPTSREQVVSDTEQLLVTEVRSRPTENESWDSALSACDKASGLRTPLGPSGTSHSNGISTRLVASGGTWVATVYSSWTKYDPHTSCSLALRNVGERGSRPLPVWEMPWEERAAWICVGQAALAPSGALAWIATPAWEPGQVAIPDDRLHARTPDGRISTIATGPTRSLTDLAINADGTSITWREAGVARSAPLP